MFVRSEKCVQEVRNVVRSEKCVQEVRNVCKK
jgi:hypothetical protein